MMQALCAWAALATGVAGAPAPQYLYRLEFDTQRVPGWRLQKTSTWTFAQGTLVQENSGPRYTAVYGLGHRSWHDFEVRTRVRFITPRIDPKRSTIFAIRVWNVRADVLPGRISIWYTKPGEKRSRAVHNHDKTVTIDPTHWYDIRVRYHTSRIAVTIDGQVVAELADVPPRPANGTPMVVYLANLKCALDYFRVVDMEPAGEVKP